MVTESIREMSDMERRVLEGYLEDRPAVMGRHTLKWMAIWACGLAACCTGGLAALGWGLPFVAQHGLWGTVVLGVFGGIVVVAALVCVYAISTLMAGHRHWRQCHRVFQQETVPRMRRVLADGRVLAKTVQASSVVVIRECEDEGTGYVFDVGEGRSLFLKGQRYFPVSDGMDWPNTDFEVVRSADGSLWIGVFCHGRKLEPVRVLDGVTYRKDVVWDEREEFINGTTNEFLQKITM